MKNLLLLLFLVCMVGYMSMTDSNNVCKAKQISTNKDMTVWSCK